MQKKQFLIIKEFNYIPEIAIIHIMPYDKIFGKVINRLGLRPYKSLHFTSSID